MQSSGTFPRLLFAVVVAAAYLLLCSPRPASAAFVNTQTLSLSNTTGGILIADLDGDGDNDVIVGDSGGNTLWLNNGAGTLSDSGQNLGSSATDLQAADFDRDGDMDVLVCLSSGDRVYFNNGAGTFTAGASFANYSNCTIADVDADGDIDVIAGAGTARVYKNNGAGSFSSFGGTFGPGGTGFALDSGDLDGDGDTDVVFAIDYSPNAYYLNDGTGVYTSGGSFSNSNRHFEICLGDVDADGDNDIFDIEYLVASNLVWLNNGSAIFANSGQNLVMGGCNNCSSGCDAGDIDNDGDIDVAITQSNNCSSMVFLNNGAGSFSLDTTFTGANSKDVALGDLDGDGDLDMVQANVLGGHKIWRNNVGAPNTAPSAPGTISPSGYVTTSSVPFTWSAGSDGQTTANLLTYNLRVGTSAGAGNIVSGFPLMGMGNAGHVTSKNITLTDGTYFWSAQTVDSGGLSSSWGAEKSFTVDTVAPTTTDNWTDNWTNSGTVNITLSATDATSGVQWTKYCIDTANTCTPTTIGTTPSVTCTAGTVCTQYVRYQSADNAGNVEAIKSDRIRQDLQNPATSITSPAAGTWEKANFSMVVSNTDNAGAGLSACYYRVVSNAVQTLGWTAYTCASAPPAITVGAGLNCRDAGTNICTVEFYNTDLAGNSATAAGNAYSIDFTAPVISGAVTPANTDSGTHVDGSYDLSVSGISDATSGTVSCDYTVNGGTTWTSVPGYAAAGATCSVTGIACTNGTALTLNFRITDNAGNQQTGTAVTRTCDTVAPTTTFVGPAAGTWEKADFIVDVTNADNLSGLATCYYRVTSNAVITHDWTTYTCTTDPTITVGPAADCRDEGSNICQIEFYNYDNVGNTGAVNRTFSIDWTAPVIGGAVTPANTDSGTHVDGTYDLSVGTISDATSGTASCDYTVNGGTSWTSVPGYAAAGASCSLTGITCTDGTALTLNFRITDNAGNQQTGVQVSRTCDTAAPTTAINSPAASAWATTTFTADVTNADTGSGLATCSYRVLSNGVQTLGWTSYTCANDQSVTVGAAANCLDEGADKCLVEFYNVDNVGNTATAVSRAFSIDFTNPTTAINAPATSTWEKASFIVDVTNSDAVSGLSACYYRVVSNAVQTLGWTSYTCANDQTATVGSSSNCRNQGTDKCLVEFYSTDVAGNTSATVSRLFSIDWTAPVISGAVTPANTDSGTHVDGTYDLSVGTISDATSGTASCDYTVNGGSSWTSVPGYTPGGATCSATGITCTDGTSLSIDFRIIDNAGNQQTGTLISRTCDTAAPTTAINAPAASSWQRLDFTADVTNADSRAGLSACYYRVVSNSVQTLAWTSYTCANDPTITVGPGMDCRDENPNICTVEFYAVDNVANTETTVSRTFSINWTGPMLQGVITPANNDSGTRVDRTFDLSASFTDPDGVASCEYCKSTDGTCDTEWTAGTWDNASSKCSVSNLTCTDGQSLTLDMRSTDIAANTGVGSAVTRLCDDTAPVVSISQPANGYKTNNPSLAVSGTTEAGAVVNVNGTAATVSGTSYTAAITLSEGANTVTTTSADAVANAASTSVTVYLDTIPPTASVSSPAAAQNVTADVAITGVATDANFLECAVYYGPGTSPTAWGVAVASTTASVSSGTLGTWHASNLYGTYTVRLAVKDMMENITEVRRQVFVYNEERFTATIPADVWSMISLPGIPQNGDPAAFLGTGRYEMQRWVASLTPDADGLKYTINFSVTAGDGFWVKPYKVPISYDFKAWVPDTTVDFEKHLLAGWNQVGVPFNRTALWSNFEYKRDGDAAAVPLVTAVSNGWLDSKIYSYSNGGFVANDAASTMQPFTGYFIYAKATGTLILDPGAGQTGGVARTVRPAYLWRLRLAAETASARDTENFIGEQSGAQAGSLVEGSPEPPAVEPYVSLYIPSAEKLAADIRAPKQTQETGNEWTFTVDTGSSEQVTLTWPDISGVPENYVLTIRDTAAGLDIDPRVTSSYSFTTGSDGKRNFTASVRNTQPPVLAEEREFSKTFQSGWTLFTVPLETAQTDVRALLGQDTAGLAIYQHYDNSLNGSGSPGGVDIQPGAAYWAYASAPAEVTFRGGTVEDGAPVDVPLAPGWNLFGSPFTDEFPVDNIRVVKDGLELTLQDAAAEGWIAGRVYRYSRDDGAWVAVQPGQGAMLDPGEGYAVRAKAGCTLRFMP